MLQRLMQFATLLVSMSAFWNAWSTSSTAWTAVHALGVDATHHIVGVDGGIGACERPCCQGSATIEELDSPFSYWVPCWGGDLGTIPLMLAIHQQYVCQAQRGDLRGNCGVGRPRLQGLESAQLELLGAQ